MTANKMMPTHGKRPEGLKDEDLVWVQYRNGIGRNTDPVTIRAGYVEWFHIIAYCPIEIPEPYVPKQDYSKWIGKVCKFWDDDESKATYGVLESYQEDSPYPFGGSFEACKHCRPVTADEIVKE